MVGVDEITSVHADGKLQTSQRDGAAPQRNCATAAYRLQIARANFRWGQNASEDRDTELSFVRNKQGKESASSIEYVGSESQLARSYVGMS